MLTPSGWYHNTLPIRVVRMRGRSDWLPREETFCAYVKRHQIMRENYRHSMASKLFYDVLRDHFGGDMAALWAALERIEHERL